MKMEKIEFDTVTYHVWNQVKDQTFHWPNDITFTMISIKVCKQVLLSCYSMLEDEIKDQFK